MPSSLHPATHEMRTYPLLRAVRHTPLVRSLVFPSPFPSFRPGRFLMLWLPGHGEKPFSVSAFSAEETEITFKAVGPFTRALLAVPPGTRLGLRGPFGNGFTPIPGALLVAGGIGIPPIRHLAAVLDDAGHPFRAVVAAATAADLLFRGDFDRWGAAYATEDGSLGYRGYPLAPAEDAIRRDPPSVLCACGPAPMLLALRGLARRHSIPLQLSFERYMKCGIGLCGSCAVDGSGICLCREGPVLDDAALDRATDLHLPPRSPDGGRPSRP